MSRCEGVDSVTVSGIEAWLVDVALIRPLDPISKPVLLELHRADIGQPYASVECSRSRLYQSSQSMVSSFASRRVLNRLPCSRSTFNDPKSVSLQALSQQLPFRLIEPVMSYSWSASLKAWLAY